MRSASWRTSGRRLRTTLPFWLETTSLFRCLRGELAHPGSQGGRELLHLHRQALLDDRGDVDVGVELVDGVTRHGVRDGLVLEELPAGVDPPVGVERLPVDPAGED